MSTNFTNNPQNIPKSNLARKIKELGGNLRCSDLAIKAGIPHETALKILKGKTKNPGVQTVAKIAQALNASMDELMELPQKDFSNNTKIENPILFCEAVAFVLKKVQQNPSAFYFSGFLKATFDIYYYSKENREIDIKFAEWCVDTHLMKNP